jgi:hypothetical protein
VSNFAQTCPNKRAQACVSALAANPVTAKADWKRFMDRDERTRVYVHDAPAVSNQYGLSWAVCEVERCREQDDAYP